MAGTRPKNPAIAVSATPFEIGMAFARYLAMSSWAAHCVAQVISQMDFESAQPFYELAAKLASLMADLQEENPDQIRKITRSAKRDFTRILTREFGDREDFRDDADGDEMQAIIRKNQDDALAVAMTTSISSMLGGLGNGPDGKPVA